MEAVINYDSPANLAAYLHRIGRTARAGQQGRAVSLIEDSDRALVKEVSCALLNKLSLSKPNAVLRTLSVADPWVQFGTAFAAHPLIISRLVSAHESSIPMAISSFHLGLCSYGDQRTVACYMNGCALASRCQYWSLVVLVVELGGRPACACVGAKLAADGFAVQTAGLRSTGSALQLTAASALSRC